MSGWTRVLTPALLLLLPVAVGSACGSEDSAQNSKDAGTDTATDTGNDAGALDLVDYVNPFIGTDDSSSTHPVPGGAGGSTYPGAVVPFGMVQLSPDTPTASPSGYRYSDTQIDEFSLTHFDGAGCPNNEDLPFLPIVGDLTDSPGGTWSHFRSDYTKSSERASPGYYAVDLDRYGVHVELTATTRTGFARFTYPGPERARPGARRPQRDRQARRVHRDRRARQDPGQRHGRRLLRLGDQLPDLLRRRLRQTVHRGRHLARRNADRKDVTSANGTAPGGYVSFDTSGSPIVQMKLGLSYVSLDNAQANLDAESPSWDFDAVRTRRRTAGTRCSTGSRCGRKRRRPARSSTLRCTTCFRAPTSRAT